jgi:hypothetical protein
MKMFRAVPHAKFADNFAWRDGNRLPGNVPYFVDNLWEFTRPADKPSRRRAVYASPTAELALESASADVLKRHGYAVGLVEFQGPMPMLFQISVKDARYHKDIGSLQKLVNEAFQGGTRKLESRLALAPLFLPGTKPDELVTAISSSAELGILIDKLAGAVTIWNDIADPGVGEISFELPQQTTYSLRKVGL